MSVDVAVFINPWKLWHGAFVPEWLMRRREPSAGAKLAYGRLCRFAGKEGVARPTLEELAEELGVEERQARRYTKELATLSLVIIERRGLGEPNLYRFPIHPWMGLSGEDTSDLTRADTCDRSGSDTEGRSRADTSDRTGADSSDLSRADARDRTDRSHVSAPSSYLKSQEQSHSANPSGASAAMEEAPSIFDELYTALGDALGVTPATTSERTAFARAARELARAGATSVDVAPRVATYRKQWPDMAVTPAAITKHWGTLATRPAEYSAGIIRADCATCAGGHGWIFDEERGGSVPCPDCNAGAGALLTDPVAV